MRSVIIANVLAGLCCLAIVGYGLIMLMISQLDPMDPYYAGIALGCALFDTFLVVPAISIVRSIKLGRVDRLRAGALCLHCACHGRDIRDTLAYATKGGED